MPIYISEVSPPQTRGWQVSLFQLAITIGILAAYLVDYAFSGSGAWRWMLGLAFVPGAILGLGMIRMPESPRWLAEHGETQRAREVLRRIRGGNNIDAEWREIQETLAQADERSRFADLLRAARASGARHRRRPGDFSASHRNQHGHLLRACNRAVGGNLLGLGSHSGHGRASAW